MENVENLNEKKELLVKDNQINIVSQDNQDNIVDDVDKINTNDNSDNIAYEVYYKRVDCVEGFLNDIDVINAFKSKQVQEVVLNNMLGDYDESGEYVIDKEILQSLVKMKKYVINAYGDVLYLQSHQSFGEKGKLQFSLSFTKVDNGERAILKMLETIKKANGYVVNTHTFVVASYSDVNDESFMTKVYKVFHIVDEDDTGKQDEEIVSAIIRRMKMLNIYKDDMSAIYLLEKEYFEKRLQVLQNMDFASILADFKRMQNKSEMFLDENDPSYFLHLNELLDMALDNCKIANASLYDKAINGMRDIMQNYYQEFIKHNDQIMQNVAQKMQEDVKQIGAPVKTKAGGKSGGKGGKGGGGKPIYDYKYKQDLKAAQGTSFGKNSKAVEVEPQGPTPITSYSAVQAMINNSQVETLQVKESSNTAKNKSVGQSMDGGRQI